MKEGEKEMLFPFSRLFFYRDILFLLKKDQISCVGT